jgi:hypothetical protein
VVDTEELMPSIPDASTPSLRHLIPEEIINNRPEVAQKDGSIALRDLFNFESSRWINLHDESVSRHLAQELELCELLNRDAATEEGAEVDVDEMTGDILMS